MREEEILILGWLQAEEMKQTYHARTHAALHGTVLVKVHVTCMMALVSLFGLTTSLGPKSLVLAVPFIPDSNVVATYCVAWSLD